MHVLASSGGNKRMGNVVLMEMKQNYDRTRRTAETTCKSRHLCAVYIVNNLYVVHKMIFLYVCITNNFVFVSTVFTIENSFTFENTFN